HYMIFNRHWYERYGGRGLFDDYQTAMRRLSVSQRAELMAFFSSRNPAQYERDLRLLDRSLRPAARFYVPISKQQEAEIVREQRKRLRSDAQGAIGLTEEQIVEDAGLDEDVLPLSTQTKPKRTKRAA